MGQGAAATARHVEGGMAAQAEIATAVDGQTGRFLRMIEGCAMTVFAGNHRMVGGFDLIGFVRMAAAAILAVCIFRRKIAPCLFITQAMIAEGIAPLMGTEIVGDVNGPE